jgi:FkbM family methyltransferase
MEERVLNDLPPNSIDVAIDVGAALGSYCWILNRKAKTVYAFEPGEEHGNYLAVNIGGTRIVLTRAAVGDSAKTVNMFTAGTDEHARHAATLNRNNPVAAETNVRIRQVEQVSLDGFFADNLGKRSVDLLKVDVEGYENAVFRGAVKLLGTHHPLVICEIEERHNADYRETFALLRSLGYITYVYRDGAYRIFEGDAIRDMQQEDALEARLSGQHDARTNVYINNFVFQHPQSRVKVA